MGLKRDLPWLLLVAAGKVDGAKMMNKHFTNPNINTSGLPQDVWDQGGTLKYSADGAAEVTHISSSNNADVATIRVFGLDINCNESYQEVTLTGQTVVELNPHLHNVHRLMQFGPAGIAGSVYAHNNIGVVTGVPANPDNIRADIGRIGLVSTNKTRMSQFQTPAGWTSFLIAAYFGLSRPQTATVETTWETRDLGDGDNWAIQNDLAFSSTGTSVWRFVAPAPDAIPEKTRIRVVVQTSSDNNVGVSGGYSLVMLSDKYLNNQ